MPNARGTTNTPVRFTAAERDQIETIRDRRGLATVAETLRRLVAEEYRRLARKAGTKTKNP